ncbi:hypothetical protein BC938DRAFT_474318 [Jimgerdemannia flammicorona]|uniref:UBC core domain-containing protein n=1 Tax=Jimgerdemannia flammicorona TaxID=994334 RepID=A0A433Q2J1_9FUNG|nr:hypothetical protein BC938DRAFT_474318 [Jimgerdemannia flammicorona]
MVDASPPLVDEDPAFSPLFHCADVQAVLLGLGMRHLQHDHRLQQELENGDEECRASNKKAKAAANAGGGKKGRKKTGASGVGYGGSAGDYYGGGGAGGMYEEFEEDMWSGEDYDSEEDYSDGFYFGMGGGGLGGRKPVVETFAPPTRQEALTILFQRRYLTLLRTLRTYLPHPTTRGHITDFLPHPALPTILRRVLLPIFSTLLRADPLVDVTELKTSLYEEVLVWIGLMSEHELLVGLLTENVMIADRSAVVSQAETSIASSPTSGKRKRGRVDKNDVQPSVSADVATSPPSTTYTATSSLFTLLSPLVTQAKAFTQFARSGVPDEEDAEGTMALLVSFAMAINDTYEAVGRAVKMARCTERNGCGTEASEAERRKGKEKIDAMDLDVDSTESGKGRITGLADGAKHGGLNENLVATSSSSTLTPTAADTTQYETWARSTCFAYISLENSTLAAAQTTQKSHHHHHDPYSQAMSAAAMALAFADPHAHAQTQGIPPPPPSIQAIQAYPGIPIPPILPMPHPYVHASSSQQRFAPKYVHAFDQQIQMVGTNVPTRRTLVIAKELAALSTGLPCSWESSVFLRVDEVRLDCIKMVLIGPKDTPYENGAFEFDIFLPAEYPAVPPSVLFRTTGAYMESNMVCGWWRDRTVQPESVRARQSVPFAARNVVRSWLDPKQVDVAAGDRVPTVDGVCDRSPGFENQDGSPASLEYNKNIRRYTVQHAMLGMLRSPPFGFEDIVKTHFRLKRRYIQHQLDRWTDQNRLETDHSGPGRKGWPKFGVGRYGHASGKEIEVIRPELVALLDGLREEDAKIEVNGK